MLSDVIETILFNDKTVIVSVSITPLKSAFLNKGLHHILQLISIMVRDPAL